MNAVSSLWSIVFLLALCAVSFYNLIRAAKYVRATGQELIWRQIASAIALVVGGGFLLAFFVTRDPTMIGYGYLYGVALAGIPMVISVVRREKLLF